MEAEREDLLVLVGPTASGKSAVAMEVARRRADEGCRPVHVVAADAMQVYQGMDIGTAKPTIDDRRHVTHWCIDLVRPGSRFTVADYRESFTDARDAIRAQGGQPMMVGGTGLYVTAIVDSLEIPAEFPEIRSLLEDEPDLDVLRDDLGRRDPVALARIPPNNRRRVIRALEVCIGSGRPFSSYGPGLVAYPPTEHRLVGIRWARDVLRRRISERVQSMVDLGLVDEVASLHATGALVGTAAQAIGYKEIVEHLQGRTTIEKAIETVVLRTCQLAVSQEKWFRRDPRIDWIDVVEDPVDEATGRVLAALP